MIQLIRSQPLSHFANLVRLNERQLLRVFIISPWIVSPENNEFRPLAQVALSVRTAKARLSVLSRSPTSTSHSAALSLLQNTPNSELLYLESLHAKLYLVECRTLKAAVFGSPNFTPQGDREYRELAADIRAVRSTDPSSEFVDDLFLFARELMADRSARFQQRLG